MSKKKCNDPDDIDVGLLCRKKCREGFKDNGLGLCVSKTRYISTIQPKEDCDKYYKYDGVATCWMNPLTATRGAGIPPTECEDDEYLLGVTCWSKCRPGDVDKGATCESCPDGYKNNGASLCIKECDDDEEYVGSMCYKKCREGYTPSTLNICREKGCRTGYEPHQNDIISCWNKNTTPGILPEQDCSTCDELHNVIYGIGTCTGCKSKPWYGFCGNLATRDCKWSCKSNRVLRAGLCWLKEPLSYTYDTYGRGVGRTPATRVPHIYGKTSHEAKCKSNREKNNSLCYLRCEEKYNECDNNNPVLANKCAADKVVSCYRANPSAATECMPKRGVSYNPNLESCPKGSVSNGAGLCVTSYVPETYDKKTIYADCTDDRDAINGFCYEKCPTIKDRDGTDIQLKHAAGLPTQCVPPNGVIYSALSYVPKTYAKKRAVKYSTK